MAKFFLLAFCLFFAACGEVGSLENLSSSGGCTEGNCGSAGSSSSYAAETSSSSVFDTDFLIFLNLQKAPDSSFVHGTTQIRIDNYRISRYLITQGLYKSVMGENPAVEKNDALPVDGVTWYKATEFCRKLSDSLGLPSNAIRMPTEAEWEYV
ncbi:MAG: formylglycine-generating enzyme family protein, partial [Fibromonadaceae bacterium]|nr:formylglycine-generating enzyme family protein [Fibromonadaceae bacterium]